MRHEHPRNLRRSSVLASDALPGVVVAGLLVVLVAWDPALTGRLMREGRLGQRASRGPRGESQPPAV